MPAECMTSPPLASQVPCTTNAALLCADVNGNIMPGITTCTQGAAVPRGGYGPTGQVDRLDLTGKCVEPIDLGPRFKQLPNRCAKVRRDTCKR